jgi:hypothetical protein
MGPAPQKKADIAVGSTTVAAVVGPASSIEDVTSLIETFRPVSPNKPPGTSWAGPPKTWPLVGVTITSTPKIPKPELL